MLESPYPGDRQRRTYAEVIAERVVTQAAKGEISAVREITDRDEGKPRQPVELGANASALLSLSDEEINRVLIETLPNFLADLPKQMFAEMMERTRKARLEIEGERVVPLDGQEDGSDKEGG